LNATWQEGIDPQWGWLDRGGPRRPRRPARDHARRTHHRQCAGNLSGTDQVDEWRPRRRVERKEPSPRTRAMQRSVCRITPMHGIVDPMIRTNTQKTLRDTESEATALRNARKYLPVRHSTVTRAHATPGPSTAGIPTGSGSGPKQRLDPSQVEGLD